MDSNFKPFCNQRLEKRKTFLEYDKINETEKDINRILKRFNEKKFRRWNNRRGSKSREDKIGNKPIEKWKSPGQETITAHVLK